MSKILVGIGLFLAIVAILGCGRPMLMLWNTYDYGSTIVELKKGIVYEVVYDRGGSDVTFHFTTAETISGRDGALILTFQETTVSASVLDGSSNVSKNLVKNLVKNEVINIEIGGNHLVLILMDDYLPLYQRPRRNISTGARVKVELK